MLRTLLFATCLIPVLAANPCPQGTEPGTAYCFGVACPCGNDDPSAGCENTTGRGGLLSVSGTTSVAADDLTFTGQYLPPNSVSLLVFSTHQRAILFRDGLLCVGPGMQRYWKHLNSGQQGTSVFQHVLAGYALNGLYIQPGETWNSQIWFRDSAHGGTCGESVNTTNAYTLTFTP